MLHLQPLRTESFRYAWGGFLGGAIQLTMSRSSLPAFSVTTWLGMLSERPTYTGTACRRFASFADDRIRRRPCSEVVAGGAVRRNSGIASKGVADAWAFWIQLGESFWDLSSNL